MNILIDLDGTILDCAPRLHGLFRDLVPESRLGLDAYWSLKRIPRSHRWILERQHGCDAERVARFDAEWAGRIEMPAYLELDQPFAFARDALATLSRHGELCLLTARQRDEPVREQLESFGLLPLFRHLVVTGGSIGKVEAVHRHGLVLRPGDMLVGDTEADVSAARELGVTAVAVHSGCRNPDYLARLRPDGLYRDIFDFASQHFGLSAPPDARPHGGDHDRL